MTSKCRAMILCPRSAVVREAVAPAIAVADSKKGGYHDPGKMRLDRMASSSESDQSVGTLWNFTLRFTQDEICGVVCKPGPAGANDKRSDPIKFCEKN